jgi:hypothetical protein
MAFIGRKPTNAPLTSDDIPNGIISAADLASGISGLITWQSVQTTGFTASAGRGYPCNTTSAAFTVTLPASPSVGDTIILLDYAGTFDTNALTVNPNSNKIEGGTANLRLTGDREGVTLTYIDSTQGWLASSGIQEGTDSLSPLPYSVDFLVVAGGGGGGSNDDGGDTAGGGGAGGYRTSTQTVSPGTVITVTVGDGGAGSTTSSVIGANGSDSSISGSGLSTITSAGGGGGGKGGSGGSRSGASGGSGGGAGYTGTGGAGNTPSTSPSQGNRGGNNSTANGAAGGGGAGAAGVDITTSNTGTAGGAGSASSITGSSVTYAGGGGGGSFIGSGGAGGTGGGGAGGDASSNPPTAGTVNLGGGGGGGGNTSDGASGGKGIVILSIPTASYSGTSTGSPTVTTSGANTILQFTGTGSYTA